jgi:hypothetical protein
MKTVGRRHSPAITFHATAENLKKGGEFNDSVNKFFKVGIHIPKGAYHYKNHEEASRHWTQCVVENIVVRHKTKMRRTEKYSNRRSEP